MFRPPHQENLRVLGLLGVGLDGTDGHRRLTRTEDFLIVGGAQQTHERLQETAIKFEEALQQRGKRLQDAEVGEVIDLLHKAQE
jgi:hypothetical protein